MQCGDSRLRLSSQAKRGAAPPNRRSARSDQRGVRVEQAFRACVSRPKQKRASAPEVNTKFENHPSPLYKFTTDHVPDTPPPPGPTPQPRGPTIIAAGLLLAALALVVLYTSRRAFLSPVAMVVVAAIGLAALLLQRRLRPDLRPDLHSDLGPDPGPAAQSSSPQAPSRAPLRLNAAGVLFAIAAVFADVLHLNPALTLITALAAVISFAISGVIVLNALRKPRP